MRGDAADMVRRLRLTLPDGWFADEAPVLRGVLAGFGSAWAWAYRLLDEVRLQTRLATASGRGLDVACRDFFGERLRRRAGELDRLLRQRLQMAMLRERGTRAGVIEAAAAVGWSVRVFEPAQPQDTGAWGVAGGWCVAGGWGSLAMPLESFMTARPIGALQEPIGPEVAGAAPAGGVVWLRVTS